MSILLATRVDERFDPTPPSPAFDIGPILPKVPSHPAPHGTAETAGSPPANHPVPSASPPPPLQPLASGHAVSRPALHHPRRSAPTRSEEHTSELHSLMSNSYA